jgi:hypothetical protein
MRRSQQQRRDALKRCYFLVKSEVPRDGFTPVDLSAHWQSLENDLLRDGDAYLHAPSTIYIVLTVKRIEEWASSPCPGRLQVPWNYRRHLDGYEFRQLPISNGTVLPTTIKICSRTGLKRLARTRRVSNPAIPNSSFQSMHLTKSVPALAGTCMAGATVFSQYNRTTS